MPPKDHATEIEGLRKDVDDHEGRIRVIEKVSAGREEQIKSLYENVGAIKVLVAQLGDKMDKIAENIDVKMKQAIGELDDRIKALESENGQKWKSFVGYAIEAVVVLLVGYFVGKLIK